MCELLHGNTVSSDHQNKIVIKSTNGNIIFDCQIKTCDGWVVGIKFLQKTSDERVQSATAPCKKNINKLHVELSHPSKSITHTTAKALGIQVTDTFMSCEDCTLSEAKQQTVSKKAVPWSKILGERLFFDISSLSTPTFGSKKHWLLIVDDSSNFSWHFFLKEKSNLVDAMIGLIKNLKDKYNVQVQYLCYNNAGENVVLKKVCKKEALGVDFKYTAPSMPQENGCIKRNWNGLWAKAAYTTMLLENLTPNRTLSLFQHFWEEEESILSFDAKIWWSVYHHLQG